jgi:predicted phosphodiesterase
VTLMRIAVLSDIHANRAALVAVLAALRREAPDAVVCCGDLVGYNAHPAECVTMVRDLSAAVVAGNHDREVAGDTSAAGTGAAAREVARWTQAQLCASARAYLAALPSRVVHPAGVVAVHGCYLNDVHHTGYVTSTMLLANLEAVAARADWPAVALCGHTHLPMCGWLDGAECVERRLDEPVFWPDRARAILINPGAVGQPRDRDPRAAFAVVDLDRRRVTLRRVAYDIGAEQRAIAAAGLPAQLGARLAEGR